jgi:hypothetical protein
MKSALLKTIALDLLKDCFADEIAHLELRMIRDAQAPRFEQLRDTHPQPSTDIRRFHVG